MSTSHTKPHRIYKSQVTLVVTFTQSVADEIQDVVVRATCEVIERIAGMGAGRLGYFMSCWRGHCEVAGELCVLLGGKLRYNVSQTIYT